MQKPSDKALSSVAEKSQQLIFSKEGDEKVFVLDTNVLMLHPNAMETFGKNIVIIPIVVVEESDHIKNNAPPGSDKRYAARCIFRSFKRLREYGSLESGVIMPNGGILYVARNGYCWDDLPEGLERSNDNVIILLALSIKRNNPDMEVVLISQDMGVYTKADALGITVEEYKGGRAFQSMDDMCTGTVNLIFREDFDVQVFFTRQDEPSIVLSNDDFEGDDILSTLNINQCCFISHALMEDYKVLMIYKGKGIFYFVHKEQWAHGKKYKHMAPRNDEQAFALALIMDPTIDIVSIDGSAGTGKTILPLLAGLEQSEKYPVIKVYRAAIEADDTLGFMPGTQAEKFAPWAIPIVDQLIVILGGQFAGSDDNAHNKGFVDPVQDYFFKGFITIEPPNHIRGRTLPGVFIFVDEAQNLTQGMIKLIVTRFGLGAKLVVVGDHTQIDRKGLDAMSNGHAHLIAGFRGQDNFGHITLKKSVRSRVADQGSRLL